MSQKNLVRIFALGSLFLGLLACDSGTDVLVPVPDSSAGASIGGKSSSSEGSNNPGSSSSSEGSIDTVRKIVNGDTIYDTSYVYPPKDTTPEWEGQSALVITEISPLNLTWLDEDGDDPAWVEIYNAGSESANLKGYSLVESLEKPRKWVFGDELIAAKSFRIVFCDKKNRVEVSGAAESEGKHNRLHTNWKIEKDGGSIYLIDAQYGIRDSVRYPAITVGDMSWGITDGGIWKYFSKPTPEAPNTESTAYDDIAPRIDLSGLNAGFHNEPVTIDPPSLPSGVKLRCTQDGSEPTKSSQEFNSPITFTKSTPFRCSAFKDGALTTEVVTKTFFVGETVNMPVVAISVSPEFFDKHYVPKDRCGSSDPKSCPSGLMEEAEYPIHVEYFPKGSSSNKAAWEIEAGISLMGGWSRVNDKKSVSITMREEYQDGRLHYPLFETRKSDSVFKAFNLRNNGNRFVSDYIEDAMAGALLEGSGVDYQRSRQVVVFYNGKYYGIHDMRERYNRNYVETNYGIDANTVEMVKQLGNVEHITASGDGTIDSYLAMLQYVGNNDMSKAENYEMAKTMLDVGNLADYMAAEIYYHNGDWPNNNVRAWRSPEHPWKFMVYDVDHGFDWMWGVNGGEFRQSTNMFEWIKQGGGNKPCKEVGCFANLYLSLIKNADFKRLFLHHSAVMWNGYLNASNVSKTVDAMTKTIPSSEMQRDLEKFERYYDKSFDKDGTDLKSWANSRDDAVIQEYKSEFGLKDMVSVTISSSKGMVLMEGMKLPGSTATSTNYKGKIFRGTEDADLKMELTAVASGGSVFTGWSGCEAVEGKPETCIATVKDGLSITANFK